MIFQFLIVAFIDVDYGNLFTQSNWILAYTYLGSFSKTLLLFFRWVLLCCPCWRRVCGASAADCCNRSAMARHGQQYLLPLPPNPTHKCNDYLHAMKTFEIWLRGGWRKGWSSHTCVGRLPMKCISEKRTLPPLLTCWNKCTHLLRVIGKHSSILQHHRLLYNGLLSMGNGLNFKLVL